MFDKLIESDSAGADFKNRRAYFIVSSIVMGIVFLSAVVFSIYAGEIGLGDDDLNLTILMAPVAVSEPEPPKPLKPEPVREQAAPSADRTVRNANILNINEQPMVPDKVSVTKNTSLERPLDGRFEVMEGKETTAHASGGTGRDLSAGGGDGEAGGLEAVAEKVPDVKIPEPPAAKKPDPPARPKTLGVVNGMAVSLPKPPYPAAAKHIRAQGQVSVQVTIDESGRVISSRAVSGHPMLRDAAEDAARKARFEPTTLSKVPVKVTGVIVYNFALS